MTVGNGGWVRVQSSQSAVAVCVRFADRDGRLEPVELYMETLADEPLTSESLRILSLAKITAWANTSASAVRTRLRIPGPDLRTAARHLGTTWSPDVEHWVARMYWSQVDGSGVTRPPLPPLDLLEEYDDASLQQEYDELAAAGRLTVPDRRPYGDDFYRSVAAAWDALAPYFSAPAEVIADQTGDVTPVVVHKWVKVARERGFLGPGRRAGRAVQGSH